jgi:hypothetical protein
MRLVSAHVTDFKSINDASSVEIEKDVTCLVGKNESGKTSFLEALYKLSPLQGRADKFDELRDFPRRRRNAERSAIPQKQPISAVFELEQDDMKALAAVFGAGCVSSKEVTVAKNYENKRNWEIEYDDGAIMRHLLAGAGMDAQFAQGCANLGALLGKLKEADDLPAAVTLYGSLKDRDIHTEIRAALVERIPLFLYFDNYSTLPGRFSITAIQSKDVAEMDPNEATARALLKLADVETGEFVQTNYEPRRASLEAAAAQISDMVFEYWTQNKSLSVQLDVDWVPIAKPPNSPPQPWLEIRIWNERHRVSLNFSERSTGFVWFFSFLTYFSAYRDNKRKLILLLDEPGLGLHAAGQADLLRLIDELLAPNHQVIYTTHSPFMVRPDRLHRCRVVEDIDKVGTKISKEVLATMRDTLFPLQAALGYELSQSLFVGKDNLIVEGPSDILYLTVISEHLRQNSKPSLSTRWVFVPSGGIGNIPTFVSLLGTQLNLAVLLEVGTGANQKIDRFVKMKILDQQRLVSLTEFTGKPQSDIEDLFSEDFYLQLLRESGGPDLQPGQLSPGHRILKRIEAAIGHEFDHYAPAAHLLRNQAALLPQIDVVTLGRFEALFNRLNPLLS